MSFFKRHRIPFFFTKVAEGVDTAFSLERIILSFDRSYRTDLKFPIIFGVCQVIYHTRMEMYARICKRSFYFISSPRFYAEKSPLKMDSRQSWSSPCELRHMILILDSILDKIRL